MHLFDVEFYRFLQTAGSLLMRFVSDTDTQQKHKVLHITNCKNIC